MPSPLVVEVCTIEKVLPHSNADKLELAQVKGWQAVIPKDTFHAGDKTVYFPPDTVLPKELTDRFGVTNYTSTCGQGQRIRQAKLRGEPSFGLLVKPDDPSWPVGMDVADKYSAVKYDPPLKISAGDAEAPHPLFTSYTDIQNMRNYPDVFAEGEEVVVTEKIHGSNDKAGAVDGVEMAGSHRIRRKKPETIDSHSTYWFPWSLPGVASLLRTVPGENLAKVVILFGEVYGMQSLRYGVSGLAFRAFDLYADGKYLDYDNFKGLCDRFGVETVPLIYRGPFSLSKIAELSKGKTTMPGADHIREGVVVRPTVERTHPKIGRVVLKYLSDDYLLSKHADKEIADA